MGNLAAKVKRQITRTQFTAHPISPRPHMSSASLHKWRTNRVAQRHSQMRGFEVGKAALRDEGSAM